MNTISAIIEPSPDGTLHLPIPEELRGCKVVVTATLRPADESSTHLLAPPELVARRKQIIQELRELGGLSDVIPDPVAWQRQMREDRPLPGRE
jgi:hypothetical protein